MMPETHTPPPPSSSGGAPQPQPHPPPPPRPLPTGAGGGSRESSEFEFVEGKQKHQKKGSGSSSGSSGVVVQMGSGGLPPPPAPLPTTTTATAAAAAPSSIPPISSTNEQEGEAATLPTTKAAEVTVPLSPSSDAKQQQQQQQPDEDHQGGSLFGWVRGASGGILSRVAEKTKSSVESVITTLDPQMKDFIHSGGDVTAVVASDKDAKVSPLREAFQETFGRATVYGLPAGDSKSLAPQPVGFASGRQGATERIRRLRERGETEEGDALLGVEGFLLEVGEEEWVEMSCLQLRDDARGISLTTYSQSTPVPSGLVARAKDLTPEDFPLRWSGLAATVGALAAEAWPGVRKEEWQEAATGVARKQTLKLAGLALAGMYKRELARRTAEAAQQQQQSS